MALRVTRRLGAGRAAGDGERRADAAVLDALTWVVALALALALARALRDYWRRRGFIAVAQDDRPMFSRVLLGARDSWDNLLGLAAAADASRSAAWRERSASGFTATTESTASTTGG